MAMQFWRLGSFHELHCKTIPYFFHRSHVYEYDTCETFRQHYEEWVEAEAARQEFHFKCGFYLISFGGARVY